MIADGSSLRSLKRKRLPTSVDCTDPEAAAAERRLIASISSIQRSIKKFWPQGRKVIYLID
ncbi:unnamed protein product [Dovyalis caffra]|uniref:Uncharacterized protein n=1 Tax=Dovyalis caffra TaxID=77055 RepID=A0AAV1R6T9_9ROSI|nr:unnamed protein product [Dovyalis caffra]